MTIPAFDIMKEYESYQKGIKFPFKAHIIQRDRKPLIQQMILQNRSVLVNPMFIELINEEWKYRVQSHCFNEELSKVIAISKAIRMSRGLEPVNVALVKKIIFAEKEGSEFYLELMQWLIEALLGIEEASDSREKVVNVVATNSTLNVKEAFFTKSSEFNQFNSIMERSLENISDICLNSRYKKLMRNKALGMFLMNYSLGDMLNAEYFLMKADLLNETKNDEGIVIKLIINEFLFNEDGQ